MSEDDQARSTGKLVLEYIATKQQLAVLQSEVSRKADAYANVSKALRERPLETGVASEFIGMPEHMALQSLLAELKEQTDRHAELLKRIRSVGLEG